MKGGTMGAMQQVGFGGIRMRVIGAACAVALLGSCAQQGVPGSENRAETVGTGAIVGAALGALIGGLAGGGRGAAIGAVGGGLLGAGTGAYVQSRNEQAALTEQQLNERSALARDQAEAYAADSRATMQEISQLQRQVNALNQQYRSGRLTESQYQERVQPLQQRVDVIGQRTQGGAAAIDNLRKDSEAGRRSGQNTASLDESLQVWQNANDRERAALDDLQRALAQGRG
jgi:hypothetical protein